MNMAHVQLKSSPLVKELTTCFVCSQPFTEPRVLPCQHSFCTDCLRRHIDNQQQRSPRIRMNTLRCPRCFQAATIPIRGPGSFPNDERAEKIRELIGHLGMDSLLLKVQSNLKGESLVHLRVQALAKQGRPSSWAFDENYNATRMYEEQDIHEGVSTDQPPQTIHSATLNKNQADGVVNNSATFEPSSYSENLKKDAGTSTDDITSNEHIEVCHNHSSGHSKQHLVQECAIQTDLCGSDLAKGPDNAGINFGLAHTAGENHNAAQQRNSCAINDPSQTTCGAQRAHSKTTDEDYCKPYSVRAEHSNQAKQQAGGNIDLNSNYTEKSSPDKAQQLHSEKFSNKTRSIYQRADNEQDTWNSNDCRRGVNDSSVGNTQAEQPLDSDNIDSKPETDQGQTDYVKMSNIKSERMAFHEPNFTSHFINGGRSYQPEFDVTINGHIQEERDVIEDMETPTDQEDTAFEFLPVYTDKPQLLWEYEKQEYDMPTSVAFSDNGENIAVTDFGNNHLLVFNGKGELLMTAEDIKPYSVALDNENNFVVSDRKYRTIKVFKSDGTPYYEWDQDVFQWVSGIGVTSFGQYAILDREFCRVGLYSPEGDKISEFGSHGDSDSHLFMADFLVVDAQDRILICDSGHHCVKVFDTKGSFLGRFGERGSSPGQLLWPRGIALDEANNVLVTDQKNNRISLFSPDGQFIQHVMPDYCSPFNLAFCGSKMAVTSHSLNGHSAVRLYQI